MEREGWGDHLPYSPPPLASASNTCWNCSIACLYMAVSDSRRAQGAKETLSAGLQQQRGLAAAAQA